MFVAKVFRDDSSYQRAANEHIVHCLQHGFGRRAHLAYNLTRLLMNEADKHCGCEPRSISIRHTVQLWSGCQLDAQGWAELLTAMLATG